MLKFSDQRRLVLKWLWQRKSATLLVRCSITDIAEELELSRTKTARILETLADIGAIEVLDVGQGQRPNKYRVLRQTVVLQVHSVPKETAVKSTSTFVAKPSRVKKAAAISPTPLGVGQTADSKRERIFGKAHVRIGEDDHLPPTPQSRRSSREGPMKTFRKKWDQVKRWGPTDIVCYYRLLYLARFGVTPEIDWPVCCGTASKLLKRLGTTHAVKHYLQVAFAIARFKPQGLNSLYHTTLYEQVRERWDDEDLIDDYEDEWVFPWLKQQRMIELHERNEQHYQQLGKMLDSPHYQERKRRETRQRFNKTLNRLIVQETYRG